MSRYGLCRKAFQHSRGRMMRAKAQGWDIWQRGQAASMHAGECSLTHHLYRALGQTRPKGDAGPLGHWQRLILWHGFLKSNKYDLESQH